MTKTNFLGMTFFSLILALGANAQQIQLWDAPPAVPSLTDKPVWSSSR
jgi:hypothetical protein